MSLKTQDEYVFEKFLLLDSRDRSTSQSQVGSEIVEAQDPINKFTFYYPVDSNNVSHISVYTANVENYFNNVNDYNNKIVINGNTYTMTKGTYSLAALITEINGVIAPSFVQLSLNPIDGLITATKSTAGAWKWTSGNLGYTEYILTTMLGFTVYPLTKATGISQLTAEQKPTPYYTRYIDFQSSRLTSYQPSDESTNKRTKNNILRLPVNKPDEVVVFENRLLNKYKFEPSSSIGYVDIALVDEWGHPALILGDFLMSLMLFKKNMKGQSLFTI